MTLTRSYLEDNTNFNIYQIDNILNDQGMHKIAMEQEQRLIKKNIALNENQLAFTLIQSRIDNKNKEVELVKKVFNSEHSYVSRLLRRVDDLELINKKVIEAKHKVTQELVAVKELNNGLDYCCEHLENNKKIDKQMIELLRHHLKEKIIHIHKKGVIHMHQIDLDNLKEYRDKYKALVRIITMDYKESALANQYVTAGIYAELIMESNKL